MSQWKRRWIEGPPKPPPTFEPGEKVWVAYQLPVGPDGENFNTWSYKPAEIVRKNRWFNCYRVKYPSGKRAWVRATHLDKADAH